jgi:putative NIF3 family GTP cyclohydrolase 1 type 2
MATEEFLEDLKVRMHLEVIRHSAITKSEIEQIAVCGGSGSFLMSAAIRQQADIFITADLKYHDFFEADNRIILADIGHYESEQFTKELVHDRLQEKFANIALHLSKVNTNPIIYL